MDRTSSPRGPILIVEDDRDIQEILTDLLRQKNYTVVCADNGAKAIACVRGPTPPCLILLDLHVPGAAGYDLYANGNEDSVLGKIPVAIFSADQGAEHRAAAMGAVACLRKPVDVETILALVSRFCDC